MKKIYALLRLIYLLIFITVAYNICEALPYYTNRVDYGEKIRIVIDDIEETNNLPDEVIIKDDEVLLSLETVKKYIDSGIRKSSNEIKINHDKYLVTMPINSNQIKINTEEKIMATNTFAISGDVGSGENIEDVKDRIYLPIDELEEVYDIDIKYNNKVIITTSKGDEFSKGTLAKSVKLKGYKREKSFTVTKMQRGDEIEILTPDYESLKDEEYLYIRTQKGELGFVRKDKLKLKKVENQVVINSVDVSRRLPHEVKIIEDKIMFSFDSIKKYIDEYIYLDEDLKTVIAINNDKIAKLKINEKTSAGVEVQYVDEVLYIPIEALANIYDLEIEVADEINITTLLAEEQSNSKEKINLVWEYARWTSPDRSKEEKINGLDVVSPTWIYVTSETGEVSQSISDKYISWARGNGYEIWPTIKNDIIGIDKTSDLVSNMKNREIFIDNIVAICKQYKFEGINLDFENMYQRDREEFVMLVRELAAKLKQEGVVTSVDVNVPDGSSTWSLCYDSKGISDSCDYLIVMAYDQYGQSSSVAGPVAGLNWVETNIKKMIERDGIDNNKLILGVPFYSRQWKIKNSKVTSTTSLSMKNANELIEKNNTKWNDELGQYIVTINGRDGSTTEIYVENEKSLEEKLNLVIKYDLAGVGAWQKAFETKEAWKVIAEKTK